MNFFKSQKGATLVLLLAIAFGVIFGTWRSTMAEKKRVEAVFQEEIVELFHLRADAGYNLCSIASRYTGQGELSGNAGDLIAATRETCDRIRNPVEATKPLIAVVTPMWYFSCNEVLTEQTAEIVEKLNAVNLSEADAQHVRSLMQELDSWNFVIANNEAYQSTAVHFNGVVLNPLARAMGFQAYLR